MIFLQPALLWGLLACIVPVLIHLLNRLRYRSIPWAALLFLVSANRSSTRHARLRQYLVLLARTLIIIFFILAAARPLVGGWLGGLLAGPPETVIVVLDRSLSMEAIDPRLKSAKRDRATDTLAGIAAKSAPSSRFVLIENVLCEPQQLAGLETLSDLRATAATDTASDMPAMLRAALDHMLANKTGRTEIWIASDMQTSNWRPNSPEWENLTAQMAALPQDVTVRILALNETYSQNASISPAGIRRRMVSGKPALSITVNLATTTPSDRPLPLTVTLDGAQSQREITLKTTSLRHTMHIALPETSKSPGWCSLGIPGDENPRDNVCYFAYGAPVHRHTAVIGSDNESVRCLLIAAAPAPALLDQSAERVPVERISDLDWDRLSLLILQDAPPDSAMAAVTNFAANGGAVLLLPPVKTPGAAGYAGLKWAGTESAPEHSPFKVAVWDEYDGPLAQTDDGAPLPVQDLDTLLRQTPVPAGRSAGPDHDAGTLGDSEWHVLAAFEDSTPFLLRRKLGKGNVFACATLPNGKWSNLNSGRVLVPMLQRMAYTGGQRLDGAENAVCGEWRGVTTSEPWQPAAGIENTNPLSQSGVYSAGTDMLALNRPDIEDDPEIMDNDGVRTLFGPVNTELHGENAGMSRKEMHSELWRLFVYAALTAMMIESGLLIAERKRIEPKGKP